MLHCLDPITAHKWAIFLLKRSFPFPKIHDPHKVFGIDFPNRLGLSAGFDKNGVALKGLNSLGFGHVEVGTATLGYQVGHKPHYIERQPNALVNRLGLPNDGVNTIANNIKKCRPKKLVVGGSIAFNDLSNPSYSPVEIYETFIRLKSQVDYIVLNPSCPNVETPRNVYQCLRAITHTDKPVLVKLHIMQDKGELKSTLNVLKECNVSGVICSNSLPVAKGGLSGAPLTQIGHQQLEWVKENSSLPVISSGGVMTPQDATDRIRLGADLVQVYTGFVYGGITFPYRVAKKIKDFG
tara:strand:+ start:75 stop:959 length:885 start_codon:yes stop_codon:yes gene_type:complete